MWQGWRCYKLLPVKENREEQVNPSSKETACGVLYNTQHLRILWWKTFSEKGRYLWIRWNCNESITLWYMRRERNDCFHSSAGESVEVYGLNSGWLGFAKKGMREGEFPAEGKTYTKTQNYEEAGCVQGKPRIWNGFSTRYMGGWL